MADLITDHNSENAQKNEDVFVGTENTSQNAVLRNYESMNLTIKLVYP